MFGDDTLFLQRFLTFAGFEPGPADGLFGVRTAAALARFEDASDAASANYRRLDSRTETAIRTLLPSAQAEARRFIDIAHSVNFGCAVKIICGTRTYREQAAIFAQGRTRPGKIVTKAGPGQSYHNFGVAWDVGFFDGAEYVDDDKPYRVLRDVIAARAPDIHCGVGPGFTDFPHYQTAQNGTIVALRVAFESGDSFSGLERRIETA